MTRFVSNKWTYNPSTIVKRLSKTIAICAQKPSKRNHKMCSNESCNSGGCTKFHQEYIHTSCTKRSHSGCLPSHSSNGLVGVAHQAISAWPYNTGGKKKVQFLKLIALDILITYNHHYARHKLDMVYTHLRKLHNYLKEIIINKITTEVVCILTNPCLSIKFGIMGVSGGWLALV